MVVDMLTSPEEQIRPCVAPMKKGGRNSTAAPCPSHRGDRHPGDVPYAHDFHRSDQPRSSEAAIGGLKTLRTNRSVDAHSTEEQRTLASGIHSTEGHEVRDERRPTEKPTWSCKRKLALTSLRLGPGDTTEAQDSEKKDSESPPPAKRWVIGPLFQSFKSKMASFTEIVMSPARLFKPNADCPSATQENKEDEETLNKKDDSQGNKKFLKKEQTELPVVQRLIFDTDSSNGSDSEQIKGTISQNGSEHGRDSVPKDDGSFGSSNSASSRSTNRVTEAVRDLNVVQGSKGDKSRKAGPLEGTDSIRTSLKKCSGNIKRAKKSKSQTQAQPLPKNLRQPTVRKRKKGSGSDRSGLAERVEKADRTEQEEESPTNKQTLEVQTLKRRKGWVSDECVGASTSGAVQLSGLNSKSSVRKKTGLMPASRSRTKKENDVKCTSLAAFGSSTTASSDLLGTNLTNACTPGGGSSSSGSITWTSSRVTRRRKNNEERKSDVAGSCCSDPEERLRSSNRTSESKSSRRNDIRQVKHKSMTFATSSAKKVLVSKNCYTRRGKRAMDAFEDQGMSMSLTLKVGSELDVEKDASSIMACGITTKDKKTGEGVILADTSSPARTSHEDRFCVKDADEAVEREESDQQRGWFLYSEMREEELEQEDDPKPGPTSGSIRLMRSVSCPDITSLHHGNNGPAAPINDKTPHHPSPLKNPPHLIRDAPSPSKHPRRHTVCSMEIEHEIAPLCLRKEVYPKWSSTSHHSHPHSPSSSLASLVSRFLSSPLAFLSKKSCRGHGDDSGYGASCSDLVSATSSSSPSMLLLNSSTSSRTASGSVFFADAPHAPETSSLSSHCSVFDAVSIAADGGVVQQESEEFSAIAEEKALSDSELKTDNKQEELRKVSSIRIRKTLPKPQYNLTPMGLPKAVRVKKKVFSVEEIYTNKNFIKPAEGRLETLFEFPLSRRDGSQSLMGPKRVKRFMEFPELGVARKQKRSLVGGAGGGGAPRQAVGNPGMGRSRRCRKGEERQLQDLDSILCAKLEELDMWMSSEQID